MIEPRARAETGELLLPATRGHMGDWVYYTALLSLREVVLRVELAEEIHESKSLNELIQRSLTSNSQRIARYLLTQPQRMMSALVIGVYGGSPRWYELNVRKNIHMEPEGLRQVEMKLGVLQLRGTERLFAIDGQHRVVGIRQAVRERASLGTEEVSVIFVAHGRSESGRQRTRRLFTTLNRYAKPVSTTEKIALDEDDVVAIVTRRLLDEHRVLFEKVSTARTVNIASRNRRSFTSLPALYQALDVILRDRALREWSDFKRLRPPDRELNSYFQRGSQFFDLLQVNFPPINRLADSRPDEEIAAEYRGSGGGHLLLRPRRLRQRPDYGASKTACGTWRWTTRYSALGKLGDCRSWRRRTLTATSAISHLLSSTSRPQIACASPHRHTEYIAPPTADGQVTQSSVPRVDLPRATFLDGGSACRLR